MRRTKLLLKALGALICVWLALSLVGLALERYAGIPEKLVPMAVFGILCVVAVAWAAASDLLGRR